MAETNLSIYLSYYENDVCIFEDVSCDIDVEFSAETQIFDDKYPASQEVIEGFDITSFIFKDSSDPTKMVFISKGHFLFEPFSKMVYDDARKYDSILERLYDLI